MPSISEGSVGSQPCWDSPTSADLLLRRITNHLDSIVSTFSRTMMTKEQMEFVGGDATPTISSLILFAIFLIIVLVVLIVILIIQLYLLEKLCNDLHIGYNLRLLYEYFFTKSIPTIHVDLPCIESDDPNDSTKKYCTKIDDPKRPGMIQCYNPSTNEWLGEVKAMNASDISTILEKAAVAQKEWCKTSYEQRRRVLRTIQKFMLEHVQEICYVSSLDSGKPLVDAALGEIITSAEKIRTINAWGEIWLQSEQRPPPPMLLHKIATVEYVPMGIIATIAPWNYPFHNLLNHIISGIFAGNAVVGKVSEYTSWSAVAYYDKIVQQALIVNGHNPDLVATITGFGDAGVALCSHPLVDKIIFTGSPGIGKKVMETASKYLKPVILELGGKDAMVLMDDIRNLNDIYPWVLRGCYQNCGQNCVGTERVFVYELIYDDFVKQIVPKVQVFRQGNPTTCPSGKSNLLCGESNDVDCGSMVTAVQIDLIQELVDDAVQNGARVLVGGKKYSKEEKPYGQFYPPTIIVDVTPKMRIFQEEVFGPVMTVIKIPNNDDNVALQMINDCNFGLSSSVYCGNQQRGLQFGRQIRSGMCCINDFGSNYLVQSLPFGGVNQSGFGRFGGIEGLRACCLERSILTDRFPKLIRTSIPPPINYPINKMKGLPFIDSLVQLFYSESWIDKAKGIIGLIKFGS